MPVRTEGKISLAMWLATGLVAAMAVMAVAGSRRVISDGQWVAHTQDVRRDLAAVSRHVGDARASVRGFLLTRDSAYLRRYAASIASTESSFAHVRSATRDNGDQQARLTQLRRVLDARVAALDRTIALSAAEAARPSTIASRLAIGEAGTRSVDSVLRAADSAEVRLLEVRTRRTSSSEMFMVTATLSLLAAAALLLFVLRRSIRRDLADRARAADELRASETKFSGILAIAADAIISVDGNQRVVHFNEGARGMFGYEPSEIIGQPLELLLPARHAATHAAHVTAFARSGTNARRMGERRTVHGRRKDGREFPADASISQLSTPNGPIFTAVVRDITDQTRRARRDATLANAGQTLAESLDFDETLAGVLNAFVPAVAPWCLLDVIEGDDGEQQYRRAASRHADRRVDAALAEWQREPLDSDSPEVVIDVIRSGTIQRVEEVDDDWMEAHTAGPRQLDIMHRTGMRSLLVAPLRARGGVIGAISLGWSERQAYDEDSLSLIVALAERATLAIENARLFRQAQRATASRDQVLSVVSHDLRNPLSAVSMLARRLADDPPDRGDVQGIGKNILASVDWTSRLMEDLLDAASIDAGKLSVITERQSLPHLVDSVLAMFAEEAASHAVAIDSAMPADTLWVRADGPRIVQVMANLVGNALKFTPAGGRVTIGAEATAEGVRVWVKDTGSGIPVADQARVFDRFWHARKNAKRRGSGLGLAIARGIVEAHGGRIWVESVVQKGSTFSFTLPRDTHAGVVASTWPVSAGQHRTVSH